jgi:N-dimethylarginine dimethylaminohydrolase
MSKVRELGYQVVSVDLSEFIKAGGAAKCLTLQVR